MKEMWRGLCCECDMAVEWLEGNIWKCGCDDEWLIEG